MRGGWTSTRLTALTAISGKVSQSKRMPRKSGLPTPLPEGFTLVDTGKKRWRLGKVIGKGGFGLIYLASQDVDSAVAEDTGFVIKVEYHENGPLFSELKFYQRAAKAELMQRWTKSRKLSFLGIPTYWGSGQADHNGLRYRFMAMERLGSDLQRVCDPNRGQLRRTTVLQIARRLVDVLEYIHDNEYVHADIKAANLMLGYTDPEKVYLADYGLSYRYCPGGIHKAYAEAPKKGHNGTVEYTSLDAHRGVAPSRRGDLQVLGFCMLHWLCGTLPWAGVLKNPAQVQEAKAQLMDNLPGSVQQLSTGGEATDEVARLLLYVKSLGYQERPDYQKLRALLGSGGPGRLDFSRPPGGSAAAALEPEGPLPQGKKGRTARGTSKLGATELKGEEEEEEAAAAARKTKPIPSRYLRGPPVNKPEASGAAPVRRSTRARAEPSKLDEEDYEREDDDDDDRGEVVRHFKGPPTRGPRPAQSRVVRPRR